MSTRMTARALQALEEGGRAFPLELRARRLDDTHIRVDACDQFWLIVAEALHQSYELNSDSNNDKFEGAYKLFKDTLGLTHD